MKPNSKNNNKELSHWCYELKKEILMNSSQKFCKHCGKEVGKTKSSEKMVEIETSEITHLCSYLQKEIQLSSSLNFCKYCGKAIGKSKPSKNIVEIETSEPEEKKDQFLQQVKKSKSKTQDIADKRALGIEVVEEVPDIKTSKITDSGSNKELMQEITKKLHLASEKYARIQISEITRSLSSPESITAELIKEIIIHEKMNCVYNEKSGELIFDYDSIRRMIKSGKITSVPSIIGSSTTTKPSDIQEHSLKTQSLAETAKKEITHQCSYLKKEIQLSSSLNFCKYCGEKLLFEEKIEKMEEMDLENVHWCSHYGKEIIVDSGLKFCKHCGKSLKEPETVIKEPLIKPILSDLNELGQIDQTTISYAQSIIEEMDRGVKIQQKAIVEKAQYKEKEVKKIFEPKPQPYIERKSFRERLGERVQQRAELKTRDKNNEVEASYIGGILIGLIIGALIGGIWQDFVQAIMIGQGVGAVLGGIIGLAIFQNRNKTENPRESQAKLSEDPVAT